MNKLSKITLLLVLLLLLSITSYANDVYFGIDFAGVRDAGFSYSKAPHKFKFCERGNCTTYDTDKEGSTIDKGYRVENNRMKSGFAYSAQIGVTLDDVRPNINMTLYMALSASQEFNKATYNAAVPAFGVMGIFKQTDLLSYEAGAELHWRGDIWFKTGQKYTKDGKPRDLNAVYDSSGFVLSTGIFYDFYTVKLLYLSHEYNLADFETGDKNRDRYLASQYPNKMSTQTIGLSVGFKY